MEFHINNENVFKILISQMIKKKEKRVKQKVSDGTFPNKHIYEL